MTASEKFYITTAISYPNGPPHIGHAYEVMASDAIARFKRIDGYDVFFMTGTDEHGQKVQRAAAAKGVTPKAYVDELAGEFRRMDETLNISFDRFIRTTDPDHFASTEELWRRVEANGDIYLGRYSGWYSVRDEAYYGEDETRLLENGVRVGGQGTPVEWVEEESYFFRLSAYKEKLLKLYEEQPDFISPRERLNEIVNFVKGDLQDLSISRTTFDWGIPAPKSGDGSNQKHVMYVWMDALNNYVTGCGFPDENNPRWKYWPADVHIIGKDITRFHAVIWPAFLMSAKLPLPKRVFGHGFVLNKGEKMSKSVGNVVDPFTIASHYGVDQVRYFFLREVPFGQDGSYSHEAIVARTNADLANDLGNLAQRSLSMIAKNLDGKLPAMSALIDADRDMLALAEALPEKARAAMKDFAVHAMLAEVWNVVAEANRYFAAQEPWTLRKTNPARMETVLATTAHMLRAIAIVAQPAIPTGAAKLLDLLGVPEDARMLRDVTAEKRVAAGTALPAPSGVFPRYVDAEDAKA